MKEFICYISDHSLRLISVRNIIGFIMEFRGVIITVVHMSNFVGYRNRNNDVVYITLAGNQQSTFVPVRSKN